MAAEVWDHGLGHRRLTSGKSRPEKAAKGMALTAAQDQRRSQWVEPVIDWLIGGDPAIEFQARRDLLGDTAGKAKSAQARISVEGWGKRLLAARRKAGHWGDRFYQPKWTSSHYTLLDLRNLEIDRRHPLIRDSIHQIVITEKKPDGGIGPGVEIAASDVCVNGMFLNYAAYFGEAEDELRSIVDFLISQLMLDGGFNCRLNRSGARHSSLHSTLSVLEGIQEYAAAGYRYRVAELLEIAKRSREFILLHRFYRSDRTGQVIHPSFLRFTYPPRWRYHVLRALEHFVDAGEPYDRRMADALGEVIRRRRPDGRWNAVAGHAGKVHFTMEKPRQPGRWATLAACRVIAAYGNLL
jgi:hypothetical protein